MYMTMRERALTAASEQGRIDYIQHRDTCPKYDDVAMEEAWKQGYKLAKEEHAFWHSRGGSTLHSAPLARSPG